MHLHPAAPVLALPGAGVQVGWDTPLVLTAASAADARFLRTLEGGRSIGPGERRRHANLLGLLAARGLLVKDEDPDAARACVRIHGAGALGTEAALGLARAGVAITVVDGGRARAGKAAHLPDADCGAVAHARVRGAVPTAPLRGAQAGAALDVVISAGPAVVRARALLAANQPHLLVECTEASVRVGPLVVPGVTACATCLALATADVREAWPVLALQGDSRRPHVNPLHASLAGALTAHEALAFLDGRPATTWRVDASGVTDLPDAPPHPDCRCSFARASMETAAMEAP